MRAAPKTARAETHSSSNSPTDLRVVEEVAPVYEGAEYARINSGKYLAQCVYATVYFDPGFRRWKALLRFRLLDTNKEVCGFLNLGKNKQSGRRSRYWEKWTLANGAPPRKRQTMSPRVFRGKVFLVEVSDVTHTGDGRTHHASAIYSTVKDILEMLAG